MTVRVYIATEGPHDVAFLAELLRPWGIRRLVRLEQVDAFWDPLIPKTFAGASTDAVAVSAAIWPCRA